MPTPACFTVPRSISVVEMAALAGRRVAKEWRSVCGVTRLQNSAFATASQKGRRGPRPISDFIEVQCAGCGMCITSCGRQVFDYDTPRRVSIVARPLQCMVGCMSCRAWCIFDAISFPDPKIVRDVIKEKKILALAKSELKSMINQDLD